MTEPEASALTSTAGADRRYPGVQPFHDSAAHRQLFRGRDKEKYELLQLVLAEPLVLLFARSGIGKSSLINAGLLQPLRAKGFFPMVTRVSRSEQGPLESLYDGIKAAAEKASQEQDIECLPNEPDWNKRSLWHFFKTIEFWRGDKLLSPLLVIDQFEELFTLHSAEQRQQLIHELADLVRGTRPREIPKDDGPKLSDRPPNVKVVLAMREDFLANLEELANRIPAVLKARFRLNPLSRENAKHAIVEPAQLAGEHFSTPAFSWSNEALDAVLDFLCKSQSGDEKTEIGDEVEPFQLQLVCQRVENIVREKHLKTVTVRDLGGKDALKEILTNFYEDSLDALCDRHKSHKKLRPRLEQLCEYGLITARGRRLLREESTIMEADKVPPEILADMVELRLLRKEPRIGDNYYELTHDTLIEPIRLSRLARETRKRKVRLMLGAPAFLTAAALLVVWQELRVEAVVEPAVEAAVEAAEKAEVEASRLEDEAQELRKDLRVEAEIQRLKEAHTKQPEAEAEAALSQAEAKRTQVEAKAWRAEEARLEAEAAQLRLEAEATRLEVDAQPFWRYTEAKLLRAEAAKLEEDATALECAADSERAKAEVLETKILWQQAQIAQLEADAEVVLREAEAARQRDEARAKTAEAATKQLRLAAGQSSDAEGERQVAQLTKKAVKAKSDAEEAEKQAKAAQRKAALLEIENNPGKSDSDVAAAYREFEKTHSGQLSPAEKNALEKKIDALSKSAEEFERLKQEAQVACERFDELAGYQPARAIGPEANFKADQVEKFGSPADSATILTMEKFVTARKVVGRRPLGKTDDFGVGERVYVFAWISSPRREEELTLEWLDKDGKTVFDPKKFTVSQNIDPGYRAWYYRTFDDPGKYQVLLKNEQQDLICRRAFVVAEQ